MMKRMVACAVTALCVAGMAQAQGSSSAKKYDWNDSSRQSCMEPYAPAVPKVEDTDLKEMIEEVKPEVEEFIVDSGKYLECLGLQMAKARENRDEERLKKLVKAHNDNVEYQKSVAEEFNATLKTLKVQAGLIPAESQTEDGKGGAASVEGTGETGAAETAKSENPGADKGASKEAGDDSGQ